jgi:hypothetical protein
MAEDREWFVWNSFKGVVDSALIAGNGKPWKHGTTARLAEPYGTKVGTISLDDLEKHGRVESCGYVVLSPERWEREREALHKKFLNTKFTTVFGASNPTDAEHRSALKLPLRGPLSKAEIEYAYRNAAKTEHPDSGGSGEQFRRVSEARDALLLLLTAMFLVMGINAILVPFPPFPGPGGIKISHVH